MTVPETVSVIIPAYNSSSSIVASVRSALSQDHVTEVLVIDDRSTDDTVARARSADDGTGRLRVLEMETNGGPAAARNRGIDESSAPFIALLDSDDRYLSGRFARIFALDAEWDIIADNILFVGEGDEACIPGDPPSGRVRPVSLSQFACRNLSQRDGRRGEMGFMKPVMRRDFLARHDQRYDSRLRLGEDFIFYASALLMGAKVLLAEDCGYVAVERADSLSGKHSASDLQMLASAATRLAERCGRKQERDAICAYAKENGNKARHRRFLDEKRELGIVTAAARLARSPTQFLAVARAILRDKLAPVEPQRLPRTLFSPDDFRA